MSHEMALAFLQAHVLTGMILFIGALVTALLLTGRRVLRGGLMCVAGPLLLYTVLSMLVWKLRLPLWGYLMVVAPFLGATLGYLVGLSVRWVLSRIRKHRVVGNP
jgi:hypothetical protein